MIELFFVACLSSSSVECEERSLLFSPEISQRTCMMKAPPELAKWVAAHPRWRVAEWSCRTNGAQRT